MSDVRLGDFLQSFIQETTVSLTDPSFQNFVF